MSDLLTDEEVEVPQARRTMPKAVYEQIYGKPIVRRKPRIPAKADEDIEAMIERKLTAGVTERELGAYIQQRRGTDTSPESHDSPEKRKELREVEQKEIGACTKLAMEYVKKTYGDLVKDGIGRPMSYGDQIEVKDGHLKKRY